VLRIKKQVYLTSQLLIHISQYMLYNEIDISYV